MKTVFLSTGQCGIQLTESLIEYFQCSNIGKDYGDYFDSFNKFRGVCVDTETKPINKICSNPKIGNHLRDNCRIVTYPGCGNNWAHGYFKMFNELNIVEESNEAIRREFEKLEEAGSICLLHSLAGGTGSGLGLRIVEDSLYNYCIDPKSRFSVSVAPFSSGEAPLQNYNSLFSLGHLLQFANGIFLFNNNILLNDSETMENVSSDKLSNCSFRRMNERIVAPLFDLLSADFLNENSNTCAIVDSLCPFQAKPFIRMSSQYLKKDMLDPYSNLKVLTSRIKLNQCIFPLEKKAQKCHLLAINRSSAQAKFESGANLWNALGSKEENDFSKLHFTSSTSIPRNSQDHAITLGWNTPTITVYLEELISRVEKLFSVRAYVHLYTKHGCEEEHFNECLEYLRCCIDHYNLD